MRRTRGVAVWTACGGLLAVLLSACGASPADLRPAMAGTYRVDKQHYHALLREELTLKEGRTLDQQALSSLDLYILQIEIELSMRADGTWTLTGSIAAEALDDGGTWTIDGDEIKFRFTREQGRPAHKTVVGRRDADGAVSVQPSAEMPGPFRMLRP